MKHLLGAYEHVKPLFSFVFALTRPEDRFTGRGREHFLNDAFAEIHGIGAVGECERIAYRCLVSKTDRAGPAVELLTYGLAWIGNPARSKTADEVFRRFVVTEEPSLSRREPPGLGARSRRVLEFQKKAIATAVADGLRAYAGHR